MTTDNDLAPDAPPTTRRKAPTGKKAKRSYMADYNALASRVDTAVRLLRKVVAAGEDEFGVSTALAAVALDTLELGE